MAPVYATTESLTGKWKIVPCLFGPRVFVEVSVFEWDTNSAYDERTFYKWRKARAIEATGLLKKNMVKS